MNLKKLSLLAGVSLVLLIAVAAVYSVPFGQSGTVTYQSRTPKPIAHIVLILEENKPKSEILDTVHAPYINSLIKRSAFATNYFAITNPSLPNYIALTSGTTAGIDTDCTPADCPAKVKNIADSLEHAGKSWKEYAETMPLACATANQGRYAARHNPFVYYPDIARNKARCADHVVPFTQLADDLKAADSLPSFSFITPNLCNDMHDCPVFTGDAWLAKQVPKILKSPAFTTHRSLLVIIWDEGKKSDNNIGAIFAGPAAKRGFVTDSKFTHYSLLRTIENVLGLQPLTSNDRDASPMTIMLR
jgi:phospholipase C